MTRRSRAREVALQLLFQRDHNPGVTQSAVEQFVQDRLREPGLRQFCLALYAGIVLHLEDIDKRLAAAAENWRVIRMATVDRNVLRLGAYELLFTKDTPAAVAFDEAIELARRYGSADSSSFVNGVLDRLRREATAEQAGADAPAPDVGQTLPPDSGISTPVADQPMEVKQTTGPNDKSADPSQAGTPDLLKEV
jgi:N utilization substance protein B